MTIKELRKMFTERVEHLCEPSLKGYYEVCWGALETLYEVGELNVRKNYYIPDEIMSLARAYESGRKIKGFTVVQSLDLMYIYATKKQARDLMGMFLGIETEQTAKPEPEQLEETAEEPEQEKAESEVPEQEEQQEELSNQVNIESGTYEHAVEMAKYAVKCGDGIQAIFHKGGKFKAGLESDREYAEKNGWQYFHTVWETVPEEERTKQQKHNKIKEARKKSLFWARRLYYKSADSHPEWREKYKSAKQELERAKAELNKEETIMSMNTTTENAFEIEFKATNPDEQKYLDMIQKVEKMGKTRYMFTVSDDFCVELIICEHDLENKNDLMNHWYQHGYVKERNATHMGLHCYYTDFDGNCYGRYNPTETKSKLNFEWVLPYTPENLGKLLAEAIKRYDDDSELVIVDVSSEFPHVYTIVKTGENWIESVNSAYKDAHEDAEICRQHMKNHPDNADYWKAKVEEYERVYYRAMRYSDFERIQRERILKQPLHEVTEQDYEEMLDVLPPVHLVEINGVSEFCMMEMYTGCYTNQYAHDKKTGKYYQKLVDATDSDTWIHKLLEKGVA